MSSSPLPDLGADIKIWSYEEAESVDDSEVPCNSIIRLPPTTFPERGRGTAQDITPPPLPPKPAFARVQSETQSPLPPKPDFARIGLIPQSAPPPLPPKPDFAKLEKSADALRKRRSYPFSSPNTSEQPKPNDSNVVSSILPPPPSRPLPPVPRSDRKPSYGEESSWVPSFPDERSPLDPPQPPEPTILSDGDVRRSSIGVEATEQNLPFLSDQLPKLKPKLPQPPYPVQCHRVASMFQTLNVSDENENVNEAAMFTLSTESAEDALYGSFGVSRRRVKQDLHLGFIRKAPVLWHPYESIEPTGQAWKVLHEYLTNNSLKTQGRNSALLLLSGYVVGACLDGIETGINLLTEIVRRMRGAERSERDGSVFTLLVNIGAHASFVKGTSSSRVEEVARKVFSDVVEDMHGRQDDDVMWERALRCYLFLLKSSDKYPSINISSKCLAALALRMGDLTHTDVDHVLICEGLFPRLHHTWDEFLTSAQLNMDCLDEIGGLKTVLTLFADTTSLSARNRMFILIYDFAVLKCLEGLSEDVVLRLRDNIDTFRALLDGHEMENVLTNVFKVGPWDTFVVDVLRLLLFSPLTVEHLGARAENSSDEDQPVGKKAFQEKTGSSSLSDSRLGSQVGRSYRTPASRFISSTRALVKYLDKPFCLRVLREIETMATHHSKFFFHRETMHHAREWKILRATHSGILSFVFASRGEARSAFSDVLNKIYTSVVEITSGRSSMKGLLHMCEIVIEFFTVTVPFVSHSRFRLNQFESIPRMFLKGSVSVPRQLLEEADASIFSLLLLATRTKTSSKRLSDSRQCLVEFLGVSRDGVQKLKSFTEDNDPIVAYRASEVVNKKKELCLDTAMAHEEGKS